MGDDELGDIGPRLLDAGPFRPEDVEVERARRVALGPHASETSLDGQKFHHELLERQPRAHGDRRVDEVGLRRPTDRLRLPEGRPRHDLDAGQVRDGVDGGFYRGAPVAEVRADTDDREHIRAELYAAPRPSYTSMYAGAHAGRARNRDFHLPPGRRRHEAAGVGRGARRIPASTTRREERRVDAALNLRGVVDNVTLVENGATLSGSRRRHDGPRPLL